MGDEDTLRVYFAVCGVCRRGSMTAICSAFCGQVRREWMEGRYGQVTLDEAYAKAKAEAEVADTIIEELKGQATSS